MALYKDKEWLAKQYKEVVHTRTIAKMCGVNDNTIERWRKKFGIERHPDRKKGARKHTINEQYFQEIDTEEKAYWLGFLMADGCVTRNSPSGKDCILAVVLKNDDKCHLKKFLNCIESDYQIKEKTISDKRGFETVRCSIKITSTTMCDDLIKNGIIPRKTGKEIIPKLKKDLIRHFVRGFFDGDGSISYAKATESWLISFCGSSKTMIDGLIDIFNDMNVNIKPQTLDSYSIPFYILQTRKKDNVKKLIEYMYSDATVYLDRKYSRVIGASASLRSNVQQKIS